MFSSSFSMNAHATIIEQMFDLNTWVEEYNLNISSLEYNSFSNPAVQKTYDKFIILDKDLKKAFMTEYRSGKISYYEMQDLITAYNNFVYYTSKTFSYISFEERGYRGKETQNAINNSYSQMRQNYAKVRHILSK